MSQEESPEQKPQRKKQPSPEQKPKELGRQISNGEYLELTKEERNKYNKQYNDTNDPNTRRILAKIMRSIEERRNRRKIDNRAPPTSSIPKEVLSKEDKKTKNNKSQILNPYGTIKHNTFYGDNSETVLRRANKNRDTEYRNRYLFGHVKTYYNTTSGKKSKGEGKRTRKYKK